MKKTLDWNKYLEIASKTVSEGIVMLKNENNTLPLSTDEEIAVFGRIQLHYYKSGTGSGGLVNVSKVTNILEGLADNGIKVNEELLNVYKKWDEENPFDIGEGWGLEPWSQTEMPIDDELIKKISLKCKTAIVIIGRTAGEEQDNSPEEGSYMLSSGEKEMLYKVTNAFEKVAVLLNVGNIIDMEYIEKCSPDAILYVWQGGMTGGAGTADVLAGKVSPSGKLTDTIAHSVHDYPSDSNFGDKTQNIYAEDIYVGYRYFETFYKNKVLYPFGFGLSYTNFTVNVISAKLCENIINFKISVKNTGTYSGKEVVQIYCKAPQGALGKPSRILCGYDKTKELAPEQEQIIEINVNLSDIACYDDSGASGNRFCYILESGEYHFYVGTDVRKAELAFSVNLNETIVTKKCRQAAAPVIPFKRLKPQICNDGSFKTEYEDTPLSEVNENKRRLDNLPMEIPFTGSKGIKLADTIDQKNTMEEFIAQLSDFDLACIIRGEGMGSPRVTAGTASAFGGVSSALVEYGIPAACCSDGPSGMRLDCGTKAFSLPNGTLIASTFNRSLVRELYSFMGLEMAANNVDCLLGPGMNIHRHPLNGRNFEYFSEDPFLTGTIAAAELNGLHSAGVTGTIKHFCANNQETNRHFINAVISERALREIYLKGYEIAVKEGGADSIMTSYGAINGLWAAGNYDLNTVILRDEWGYTGFTMTDWWANINERGKDPAKTYLSAMARAQNDVYMVCADCEKNEDDILKSLQNGTLTRGELQRNAKNILNFLIKTNAMKRLMGEDTSVEILNRPADASLSDEPVVFYDVDNEITLNLENVAAEKSTNHSFALTVNNPGYYKVTLTASSDLSELAQIPVTLFVMGTASGTFTWNGTKGKPVSFEKIIPMFSRFTSVRLYFAQNGLKMHSIRFENIGKEVDPTALI